MSTDVSPHALVTGANRGIGLEIARQLAHRGLHVLLTGRREDRAREAAEELAGEGLAVTPLQLDVTDADSIHRAASTIASDYGTLDVLVNNAAVRVEKYGNLPSQQPLDDWRTTFETNLLGVVSTTRALLPMLHRANAARIVNVSSLLGSNTTHCDATSYAYSDTFKSLPAYSASKSALNSWTIHLAYELRHTPIKVNAVHPGYTRTGLNDGEGDQQPSDGALTSVEMALLPPDGPTGTYRHFDTTLPW